MDKELAATQNQPKDAQMDRQDGVLVNITENMGRDTRQGNLTNSDTLTLFVFIHCTQL